MAIRLSYIAPVEYLIDNDGEYVEIKYKGGFSFSMTDGEVEEWASELGNIADHMRYLHNKFREENGRE